MPLYKRFSSYPSASDIKLTSMLVVIASECNNFGYISEKITSTQSLL